MTVNERLQTCAPKRNGGPHQHAAHLSYSTAVSVTRQAAGQQWHSAPFDSFRVRVRVRVIIIIRVRVSIGRNWAESSPVDGLTD